MTLMQDYILSCCSTADLSAEHFKERNISYICFHYTLDGKEYSDDLGKTIPFDEFYQKMADGAMTQTSQVSAGEYEDYFSSLLETGKDVLHLCLSSGISGSYRSAVMAAENLREKYPDRKLIIIDSLGASSGFGLLIDMMADKRDEGMDIDALAKWTEENRLNIHLWFFSTDLTFFVRGGRVSKAAGFFGGMLNICPLLNVNTEGRLIAREKIRGKKKVIEAIAGKMEQFAENGLDYNGKCYISHSACYGDARAVADIIEEKFKNLNGKVLINDIGTTIGSHTGPGTVALFFYGKDRV